MSSSGNVGIEAALHVGGDILLPRGQSINWIRHDNTIDAGFQYDPNASAMYSHAISLTVGNGVQIAVVQSAGFSKLYLGAGTIGDRMVIATDRKAGIGLGGQIRRRSWKSPAPSPPPTSS